MIQDIGLKHQADCFVSGTLTTEDGSGRIFMREYECRSSY
jgi:hypothetical protein